MRILLTGATGGIGSAIKVALKEHEFVTRDPEWLIFAQGFIGENNIDTTFEANVLSCIEITEKHIPYGIKGVIYISSAAGVKGNTKYPIYSASKAALNSYCEIMSRAHPELQFYSICPGPTDTKMWKSLGISGKPQPPEAVAKAVRLCMEGAFTSGDLIQVRDGICSIV